ncbi:zinc ribbon domain-containing protein [Paenibacillus roseipurpureus]|uniref:Zinc ribbon domain-containing protein n=1 Tax=Paenibacillus roseopurpureus TaxID=2918901 RepID=A0AA96LNJ9_9BACL|nr:zinc ribbon domain-containing protein [Paenibacillus sp. MBLB1832]WNR42085.1 zinc ribbon domain-containing protein [Paenibacillus sp. MBLB1832]
MSFFDKVKQGASEAAKKAQQTVEITKFKTQISLKEREIDKIYKLIGESVFASHQSGNMDQVASHVADYCTGITVIQLEISDLEQKIAEIRNEKECVCGKVVATDTKFCSSCGHHFV